MPRIAVIGAGLIGRSWAIVFAAAGWEVALYDADPQAAEAALGGVADGLADLGWTGSAVCFSNHGAQSESCFSGPLWRGYSRSIDQAIATITTASGAC